MEKRKFSIFFLPRSYVFQGVSSSQKAEHLRPLLPPVTFGASRTMFCLLFFFFLFFAAALKEDGLPLPSSPEQEWTCLMLTPPPLKFFLCFFFLVVVTKPFPVPGPLQFLHVRFFFFFRVPQAFFF